MENFDCNMFKDVFIPALRADIREDKYTLGTSALAMGIRRNVAKNLYGLKTRLNNIMLFGMMYEAMIQQKQNLRTLLLYIHNKEKLEALPITPYKEMKDKEAYWEAFPDEYPGYEIRMHPDHYNNIYTIEIKATKVYKSSWTKKLAPYQVAQENWYIVYNKHDFGFLHKLNIRAFINKFNSWEELWDKWGFFKKIYPDIDLFNLCLSRAKFMFEYIDTKKLYVSCPEQIFECDGCEYKACKNPITKQYIDFSVKCEYCGEPIELTKKASGDITALCYMRNDKYYHGNDKYDSEKWEACREALKGAWRHDEQ